MAFRSACLVYGSVCLCVLRSSTVCVPSPSLALQLVSLTDPTCSSDISAPVLAGEEEGESGDYVTLLLASKEPPGDPLVIFSKESELLGRGGAV